MVEFLAQAAPTCRSPPGAGSELLQRGRGDDRGQHLDLSGDVECVLASPCWRPYRAGRPGAAASASPSAPAPPASSSSSPGGQTLGEAGGEVVRTGRHGQWWLLCFAPWVDLRCQSASYALRPPVFHCAPARFSAGDGMRPARAASISGLGTRRRLRGEPIRPTGAGHRRSIHHFHVQGEEHAYDVSTMSARSLDVHRRHPDPGHGNTLGSAWPWPGRSRSWAPRHWPAPRWRCPRARGPATSSRRSTTTAIRRSTRSSHRPVPGLSPDCSSGAARQQAGLSFLSVTSATTSICTPETSPASSDPCRQPR